MSNPLTITCPKCGAPAGRPCSRGPWSMLKPPADPHPVRVAHASLSRPIRPRLHLNFGGAVRPVIGGEV